MPMRVLSAMPKRVMSSPFRNTLPLVGLYCPVSRLNRVVFPAPFGPMIDFRAKGLTLMFTRFTATWPPKRMVRSLVSMIDSELLSGMLIQGFVPSPLYCVSDCGSAPSPYIWA